MSAPTVRRRRADSIAAEARFRAAIARQGGRVDGQYVNNRTPVECTCPAGHRWRPWPANVSAGLSTCFRCSGRDGFTAEANFRAAVAERGGQVVGEYADRHTGVDCICPAGHPCKARPSSIQRGRDMCLRCAGNDPATSETNFRAAIEHQGGKVVGNYVNSRTSVACVCSAGHPCKPRPDSIQLGRDMCRRCARQDPADSEANFRALIAEQGGQVVGDYVNSSTRVLCVCPAGHPCTPQPNSTQQGYGMCRHCAGKTWDVFYVIINPTVDRVKFGITSGFPRKRLSDHRAAGYTGVVRLLTDLTDAAALERHVLATLRDARIPPVQGREYYHLDALPVVLDVADGWTSIAA